jgi:hypothetical protein
MPGRFDALTQLDKNPVPVSSLVENPPRKPENLNAGFPENLKTSSPDFKKTRLPENLETGKPGNLKPRTQEKAEKYSTQLQPSIIKHIKQYALEHDVKDYEVIQEAVSDYLNKNSTPENLKT